MTDPLDDFLRAYDAWVASPDLCGGSLFERMIEAREAMTCPFYGKHDTRVAGLIPSGGNQCALVRIAYSPCRMEMAGLPVEWETCLLKRRLFHQVCVGCGNRPRMKADSDGLCPDCLQDAELLVAESRA